MIVLFGSNLLVKVGDILINEDNEKVRVVEDVEDMYFKGYWIDGGYESNCLLKSYEHWKKVKYLETRLWRKLNE